MTPREAAGEQSTPPLFRSFESRLRTAYAPLPSLRPLHATYAAAGPGGMGGGGMGPPRPSYFHAAAAAPPPDKVRGWHLVSRRLELMSMRDRPRGVGEVAA